MAACSEPARKRLRQIAADTKPAPSATLVLLEQHEVVDETAMSGGSEVKWIRRISAG
jgi:hypothetical protein